MEYLFDSLESIVGMFSVIVSIIIFVQTVKTSEKERVVQENKENYYDFLKKIDELFKKVDPEKYYDTFSTIYSDDEISCKNVFSEIKHEIRDVRYIFQEVLLYIPNNSDISVLISKKLEILEEKAINVNECFLSDLQLIDSRRESEIVIDDVLKHIDDYEKIFDESVVFVFNGLHIIHNQILGIKDTCVDSFVNTYKENANHEE